MSQSLAERTRAAARERPFLVETLRAGACNYAAAARSLDVEGDPAAIATALRRFAEELPAMTFEAVDATVTMNGGWGRVADPAQGTLVVDGTGFAPGAGRLTAILARGELSGSALSWVLRRLEVDGVPVQAAGVTETTLVVIVERRTGPRALRTVEDALDGVPVDAVTE